VKSKLVVPLASILIATAANAQAPAPAAAPPLSTRRPVEMEQSGTPGKAVTARTLRITATVHAIDVPTRIVTLQHDMGGVETLKVGPAVKNLDRFAVGDTVVIDYEQGLALEFQPPGSEFVPPTEIDVGTRDDRGQLSAGTAGAGMRSTVTVFKIDAAKRLVTLQGPGGNLYKVKAGPKIQLEKLKVGDKLLATYVEAVAITLEKAKK
jgi:Cu/Ag efflux protein CusF